MLKYAFANMAQPTDDNTANSNVEMENGYLTVEVITSDHRPLPKATVMIYSEDEGVPMTRKVLVTGIDGKTETAALPAPAKKYSLEETSIVLPYSRFTIRVEYPGYYTNIYKNSQVFADTNTIQTSTMTPLPLGVKNTPGMEKIYEVPAPPIAKTGALAGGHTFI